MTSEISHRPARSEPFGRISLSVVKVLIAVAFLGAAGLKLSGNPKKVAEFGEIGLGQAFRYVTGGIEGIGAFLVLWPRTAFAGTLLLIGICGGALLVQLEVLHGDLRHVFALGGLVLLVAWLSRPDVLRSRPR